MIHTLWMLLGIFCLLCPLHGEEGEEPLPKYLYKILSFDDWVNSKESPLILLPIEDRAFVHLAKENQIGHILTKYWSQVSEIVLLKLDPKSLGGRLVYETNPGGTSKYYHLYQGAIPRCAVVEAKIIHRDKAGGFLSY